LPDGSLVLGKITAINQYIVQLEFPISIRAIFDDKGDLIGISSVPYQMPFAKISPFATVNFNINQIVSFAEPSPELVEQYETILKKLTERYLALTSGMIKDISDLMPSADKEEPKEEKKSEEEEFDIGFWKPFSTSIH
jgi:hypothetical protein